MRQRQDLADGLRPFRHAPEREHESGQQNRGQEEEESQLHGLHLGAGDRGESEAKCQVGHHEDRDAEEQDPWVSHKWDIKQDPGSQQDDQCLPGADGDIGQDLPEHHFNRFHRHGEQVFNRALFRLPRHRHSRDHHQCHGQDHAKQAGHDVVTRHRFRIVHLMDDQFEGRLAASKAGERAFQVMPQGIGENGLRKADGAGGCGRVCRVRLDQDLRLLAAYQLAGKACRDRDHKSDFPTGQQVTRLARVICLHHEVIIVRRLERLNQCADDWRLLLHQKGGGQVFRVHVDGIAEQDQLHDGDAEHDREGETVPADLDRFLHENGPDAAEGVQQAGHA